MIRILLLVISAFVFVVTVFVFQKVFIEMERDYISSGVGAFMGAFFAFLFLRIAQWFDALYQGKQAHYEILIKLEQICNEYLGIIDENKAQIGDWLRTLKSNNRWGNQLEVFPRDKDITLKLKDFDLLNNAFRLDIEARRLNASIDMIFKRYRDLHNDYGKKLISDTVFSKNISVLLPRIEELLKFHDIIDGQTKNVLIKTRILQYLDKPLIQFFKRRKLSELILKKEMEKLEKELKASRAKSAIEIMEVLGKK